MAKPTGDGPFPPPVDGWWRRALRQRRATRSKHGRRHHHLDDVLKRNSTRTVSFQGELHYDRTMSMRPYSIILGSFLALAGFFGSAASAQTKVIKEVNAHSTDSWKGVDLYKEFCAVCHGTDGKGNGPAASALKAQPTDLTTITRRNNSKYPELKIQQIIKGDGNIPAHGSLDMPTWGNIFKSISSNGAFGEMRINALVTYLQQIQR
jgi:mono/diheme cytochrome c family protein